MHVQREADGQRLLEKMAENFTIDERYQYTGSRKQKNPKEYRNLSPTYHSNHKDKILEQREKYAVSL